MMRKEAVRLLEKHLDSLSLEGWSVSKDACKVENIVALWEIMQEFNAPVRVTQAVLDAVKEEYLNESYYFTVDEYGNQKIDVTYLRNINPVHLLGKKIIADCPLALQVLLQFNVDGERKRNDV